MALPQLAGAGASLPMLKDAFSQQDQHGDLLASLVDLTKDLVDGQAKLFQKLLLAMDAKDDDTTGASASGSVEGVEEEMTLGVKDLFLGAFAAITLWANDLAKYIRAVMLPEQLLAPVIKAFKAAFNSEALVKGLAPIKAFFSSDSKLFKPITEFFDDIARGFKSVGETMVKARDSLAKFLKTSKAAETIGKFFQSISNIFESLKKGVKTVTDFIKPIASMFSSMSGLSTVGETIKKFVGKAEKFLPMIKGILSKVLLPLFAIFDFVSGFIEGFKDKGEDDDRGLLEKTFDGMIAGALEVIKGIFVIPLDLIKSFISWIAGKLGFKNVEKELDSFKFADIFDGIVKKIKDFMEFMKNLIKNPIDTLTAAFSDDLTPEEKKKEEQEKKKEEKEEQINQAEEAVRVQQGRVNISKRAVKIKSFRETEEESAEQLKEYEQSQVVLEEKKATLAALKAGPPPPASLTPNSGLQPEGAQLSDATKEVAVKKEENQGQAAPVVIQAGNGDTNNYGGGTTILGPSEKSNYADNWAYS